MEDDIQMDPPETPSISTFQQSLSTSVTQPVFSSTNTQPSKPLVINNNINRTSFHTNMSTIHKSSHAQLKTPFTPRRSQVSTPSNALLYSQQMFKPKDVSTQSFQQSNSQQQQQQQNTSLLSSSSSIMNSHQISSQVHSDIIQRTPFKPSAPREIPSISHEKLHSKSLNTRPPTGKNLGASLPPALGLYINSPSASPIPQSLPNVTPSYPATLFGGLSADDEHVTVWEPRTGKTVAGNAAPYRRNLKNWLEAHPGWEEKADELKSSKRRSAAKRSKNAADSFAALCCFPVATYLLHDANQQLNNLDSKEHCNEQAMSSWNTDDFMRLQEALYRLGQECHSKGNNMSQINEARWSKVQKHVGAQKMEATVIYCAHHLLKRGITKSQKDLSKPNLPSSFGAAIAGSLDSFGIGSPASFGSFDVHALPSLDNNGQNRLNQLDSENGASILEKAFRAPREPRVTVWNPTTRKTISGNAAPCRRNLSAWIKQHPGWVPKEEGQLSSSRRNRNRKIRSSPPTNTSVASSIEAQSPHFNDAIQGLLGLWKSPAAYSPSNAGVENDSVMVDDVEVSVSPSPEAGASTENNVNSSTNNKPVVISSVSSSSADDVDADFSGAEERDADDNDEELEEEDDDKMEI